MDDVKYLPWPYGKLGSKERSELYELKEAGYDFSDPIDIIDIFALSEKLGNPIN